VKAAGRGVRAAGQGVRIRVINPNTTWSMTRAIGESARAVAAPGTLVEAVSPAMGPASIESHYDEALAVPGLLAEIARGERDGCDGYVIACFGDPGLQAARELAVGPVVGIAEAAMHTASFLGRSFSVVTTLERTRGRALDLAVAYGQVGACRSVRACGLQVLDLETDLDARKVVVEECRRALAEDGSDVVVLGCAGMGGLGDLTEEVGAPVVEGVAAATLVVQSLVMLGLRGRPDGEFAAPPPKPYAGLLAGFGVASSGSGRDGPHMV
jgi:allantoin racemase